MKTAAAILAIAALAAGLRFADLPLRPMHADEAILADKFGTLLETGRYTYDARDYHGPLLLFATLIPARVAGTRTYTDLSETTLRAVPALAGVLLALSPLLLVPALSRRAALIASLLIAVSPAMVFYSRYYIAEMLLVAATAAAMGFAYQFARSRRLGWAAGAGISLVLMFAAKETAVIATASLAAALALRTRRWMVYVAAGAAFALAVVAWPGYVSKAFHPGVHGHPWWWYLSLLLLSGEALLTVLAVFARSWTLLAYALLMTVVYSVLPYKTPWCLVGFWHAWLLLAGAGAAVLLAKRRWAAAPLAACFVVLLWQSWRLSFPLASDPRNPYVYAQTLPGVFEVRDAVARLSPETVQVIAKGNVWPLPWYFRCFPKVEYWTGIAPGLRPAPVVVVEPEFESALAERVYAAAPPGEHELYVPFLHKPADLRPGIPLQVYARKRLYDRAVAP